MKTEDIQAELAELLRDFFDADDLVVTPELSANDVDGWDSLAHVRLLLTVERRFQVKFAASEVAGLKTVGDLAALVRRKRGGAVA